MTEENAQITTLQSLKTEHPGVYKKFAKFTANKETRSKLRANSILTKDQWKQVDDAVYSVARKELNGIADLQNTGLTVPIDNLGVQYTEWNVVNDVKDATVSMSGESRGDADKIETEPHGIPLPIVHFDFTYNARELEGSRRNGLPLDTTTVESATWKVSEKLEDILFSGSIQVAGDSIYGYTDHGDINTHSGSTWGTVTNPWSDVLSAISSIEADNFNGPYMLYLNRAQMAELREIDTSTNAPREQLITRIRNMDEIEDVKVSGALSDGTGILVQLDSRVVDLAVAMDIEVIDWESPSGMTARFKVMACMAPRVKSTYTGQSGICKITGI